jgi:hypothetical protein
VAVTAVSAIVQRTDRVKQSDGPNSRCNVMAIRVPDFTASAPAMRSCNAGRARITAWEYVKSPVAITPPTTIRIITINSADPESRVSRFMRASRS